MPSAPDEPRRPSFADRLIVVAALLLMSVPALWTFTPRPRTYTQPNHVRTASMRAPRATPQP